ncbi:Protein of unknown function, partial [Gryllus bimaculatus]
RSARVLGAPYVRTGDQFPTRRSVGRFAWRGLQSAGILNFFFCTEDGACDSTATTSAGDCAVVCSEQIFVKDGDHWLLNFELWDSPCKCNCSKSNDQMGCLIDRRQKIVMSFNNICVRDCYLCTTKKSLGWFMNVEGSCIGLKGLKRYRYKYYNSTKF